MPISLFFGAGTPLLASLYYDNVGNYYGAFVALGISWCVCATLCLVVRPPVKRTAPTAAAVSGT